MVGEYSTVRHCTVGACMCKHCEVCYLCAHGCIEASSISAFSPYNLSAVRAAVLHGMPFPFRA